MIYTPMRFKSAVLFMVLAILWVDAGAASLEADADRALRKIGIGPEQAPAYGEQYAAFIKKRDVYVQRALRKATGEQAGPHARRAARRAAKRSVKAMSEVLSADQLKYYEAYLELDNKIYLRANGLR